MKHIAKLSSSSLHENSTLAAKINEIIDAINKINKCTTPYITPGPSPYDLNAWPKPKPQQK